MVTQVAALEKNLETESIGNALDAILSSNGPVDLCRQIVHGGFAEGTVRGCALYYLDNKLDLKPIASYGQVTELGEDLSAWDDSPLSEAIRDKIAVVGLVEIAGNQHSILAIALSSNGVPRGLLALTIEDPKFVIEFTNELGSVISKLGAMYLESLDFGATSISKFSSSADPDDITSRQLTILGHIDGGLVNLEIAKLLMLSESTIRQETVRIYRSLGVGNRLEAVKRAKSLGILPKHETAPI